MRIDSGGEKVDGIPDASGFEQSVSACEYGHRYGSGDATLDAGGYGIGFQWKPCADKLRRDGHALDDATLCGDEVFFEDDWDGLFVFARKYFTEPTNATGKTENDTEGADRGAGQKAREHQDEAESQNNGPGG